MIRMRLDLYPYAGTSFSEYLRQCRPEVLPANQYFGPVIGFGAASRTFGAYRNHDFGDEIRWWGGNGR